MFVAHIALASPPALVPFTGYVTKDVNTINLQLELVNEDNDKILWCQKNENLPVAKRRFMVNIGQVNASNTSNCVAADYADLVDSGGLTADVQDFTLDLFGRGSLQVRLKINGTRIDTPQVLQTVPYAANAYIPPGVIQVFIGDQLPSGWLWCDGRTYNDSAYPKLATVIGNNFGSAEGDTFKVPDLRGRFLRGLNDMDGSGTSPAASAGNSHDQQSRTVGSFQGHSFDNHNHGRGDLRGSTGSDSHAHSFPFWVGRNGTGHPDGSADNISAGSSRSYVRQTIYNQNTNSDSHTHSVTLTAGNTATTGNNETRPVNIAVRYIIKY
jgi:hypothetical protein